MTTRDPALADALGLGPTSTGVLVNADTAFNSSAYWSGVSIISVDVASLPLEVFKRDKDGANEPYVDSKTYELVHDNPNPEMTAIVMRESMQAHALTWGNAYAEIERDGGGRPRALWPITPDRVSPFRQDGRVKYRVRNFSQGETILEASNTLHVPGLGFDGLIGYSVLEKARESLSMGIAMQRFGGAFYGNGSTFGGVLSHPQNLTKEVKQGIRESIDAVHTGVERAHKFVILGGGMTYTQLGIPPNDAQFLESRRFEIEEIARWLHMPQHKLNGLDHATFSNIEHLDLEYFKSCLRGWLVRWEQELNRKLISSLERKTQYFKHNVEGFLRGDSVARADFYTKLFSVGGVTINDILSLENRNGIGKDGDTRFIPANMMPLDRALNPPAPTPVPPTPAVAVPPVPKRDEAIDGEFREILIAIADDTKALQASVTAEQDARHAAECATLRAEAASLQHQLLEAHAERDRVVQATADQIIAARSDLTAAQQAKAEADSAAAVARTAYEDAVKQGSSAATQAANEEAARVAADERLAAALRTVAETERRLVELSDTSRGLTDDARAAQDARDMAQAAVAPALEAQRQAEQAAASAVTQLAEAQVKLRDAEATLLAQRQAETERLAGMVAAHRALIVDAMGRMVRRETEKARRHQATAEKLRAWAEAFYVTHEDICREALRPAIRAHLAWKRSTDDVDAVTASYVREHIAESVRQVRAIADGDPEDLLGTLERMLTRWEQQRPDALADRVLQDELDYVRSYR